MAPTAPAVKAVIWDLDDTLWRGTLAEGDEVVPNSDALRLIDALDRAGVIQSIASKNDAEQSRAALRAFDLLDVFVYVEISWSAKSAAVRRIVDLLGVGADTVVFLDNAAFERAEVEARLPGVRCFALEAFLEAARRGDLLPRAVTSDSARRPRAYREEGRRQAAQAAFSGTPVEFLHSLDLQLTVRGMVRADLMRAAELTERTNQLNTTGVVLSGEEIARYETAAGRHVLVAELVDRFGDYGRIGLCLLELAPDHVAIDLLLMSCRVGGRNLGRALVGIVAQVAASRGVPLRAAYRPTGRNRQMQITYALLGFRPSEGDGETVVYSHGDPGAIEFPSYITATLDAYVRGLQASSPIDIG